MLRYAMLDFDSKDTQDQYAIAYNNYQDGSGDTYVEWFDTDDLRAKQVAKDINNGIIFLTKWEEQNAQN